MNFRITKLWSIRNRILLSITFLLFLSLVATLAVSKEQLGMALARGDYLKTHFKRFVETQEHIGGFLEATVGTIAADPSLASCLRNKATPLVPADDESSPGAPCDLQARYVQLTERLDAAFRPGFVLITDGEDQPLGGAEGLTAEKLRRQLFYQRASQGLADATWAEVGGDAYLMAGAPIKANGVGPRMGTLVVGIALERLFRDHAEQSGTNRAKLQHVFFIEGDQCLGSSFSTKEIPRAELVKAFREHRSTVTEGGEVLNVFSDGDVVFDLHTKRHDVLIGDEVRQGDLVVARQRTHHAEEEEKFFGAIYITGAISMGVGVILALILAWTIMRPLRGFLLYTEQVATGGGDLTYRFPVKGNDELALLGRNLNAMLEQLQFLFGQVKHSSLEVGNSAAEISITARQLHQRSQEQSVKIEDITTAVNEMNQMIQQLAGNATNAAEHAQRGSEAVSGASTAIIDIRKVVVDSSDHVKNLGEHSVRIGNIVETIRQIADQTSLLALNASIEAAHAGEHGKGFAVVANEVSNLAERVNKSARQIEEQLAQIRLLTEQAVRKMEEGASTVDQGVIKVDSTFRDLNEMMSVVQEIGEREREQAQVSDNIARNMEDIFMIVREGLSATEQTVHEGERLKDLGRLLLESVDKFKTGDASVLQQVPALPGRRAEDRFGDKDDR